MKAFLIGFSKPILVGTAYELKQKSVEILYWTTRFPDRIKKDDFPGTIFHWTRDAIAGIGASQIDENEFEPVSQELASQLYECESQTLTMMNRVHYAYELSLDKRKMLFYSMVKYWDGVLKKFKPDAILFPTFPHLVYDFVIYSLAKLYNIKTIMFDFTRIPDKLLIVTDLKTGSQTLHDELEKNCDVRLENLSKNLQEYYFKMTNREKIYFSFKFDLPDKKRRVILPYAPGLKFSSVVKSLKEGSVFFKIEKYLKKVKHKKLNDEIKKEYLALQSEPDFKSKYIYAPLHLQPENTTSPLGGIFSEQILMLEILSKAIPENWKIYVKEYPLQWKKREGYESRHKGYYHKIAKLRNTKLVPIETSSNELILNSMAVATVTGTAGWEAIFREKPALVFGYAIYNQCEGVFRISNVNNCRAAINKIENGYKPSLQKVLNFLAAMDRASISARLGIGNEVDTYISESNCIKNLADAILKEMSSDRNICVKDAIISSV